MAMTSPRQHDDVMSKLHFPMPKSPELNKFNGLNGTNNTGGLSPPLLKPTASPLKRKIQDYSVKGLEAFEKNGGGSGVAEDLSMKKPEVSDKK